LAGIRNWPEDAGIRTRNQGCCWANRATSACFP